jgi:hypothetical protein
MDTIRHEYRLKGWVRVWYLTLGVFLVGISARIIAVEMIDVSWRSLRGWGDRLVPSGLCIFGCYMIVLVLRSRVILDATRITVRYSLREKSADVSEIIGYQTYTNRKLSFWQLQSRATSFWHLKIRGSGNYISIVQLFNVDSYFLSWLQQLPNLDNLSLSL